jgi:putative ABC transport system permease protein
MNWLKQLFTRHRHYDELSQTIREHLDEKIADLMDRGMTREQAERTARREFGNVTRIEERSREIWQWQRLESVWADAKHSLRRLKQSPGFTAAVILTMVLGIGATTSIFTLVDATLLRSLPYPEADRIIHIKDERLQGQSPAGLVSVPRFFDLRAQSQSFEAIAFFMFARQSLTVGAQLPVAEEVASTSGEFWKVYGVQPLLGRTYDERDDQPNVPDAIVLSYAGWRRIFGGDPHVIGRQVKLDQQQATIVGVMPESFRAPTGIDLWRPAHFSPADWAKYRGDGVRFINVFARLKPGISLPMAQQDLRRVGEQLRQEYPATDGIWRFDAESLRDHLYGNLRPVLLMLLSASGLLLLIACINVANLLLSRAISREREVALRRALGASNSRIMIQFLTESTMLSLIGGSIGLGAAFVLIHVAAAKLPGSLGVPGVVTMQWPVVGFAFTLSVLTGIAFGLAPGWMGKRVEPNMALKRGETRLGGAAHHGTRSVLIAVQIGFSLVLLIGASLLTESLWNLLKTPLGFEPDHLLTFSINLPWGMNEAPALNFYAAVQRKIEVLPGVVAVGQITALPTAEWHSQSNFDADWLPRTPHRDTVHAEVRSISGDYLRAMSVPVLAGRKFIAYDEEAKIAPVLINQTFAQRYLPNGNPVGRHLISNDTDGSVVEIVGVIGNVRGTAGSITRAAEPEVYFPANGQVVTRYFVMRLHLPSEQLLKSVREQVHQVDPQQAIGSVSTMDDLLSEAVAQPKLNMVLVTFFAVMALLLACVGVYGVVAYSVAQRTQEIGVRMAMGATRAQISLFFVKKVLIAAGIGITGGEGAALLFTKLLRSELYDVAPYSPLLHVAAVLLLLLPIFLATLRPALAAAAINPTEALRAE